MPARRSRPGRALALSAAAALALGLLTAPTVQAADWDKQQQEISKKVDNAGDLVQNANKAVNRAMGQLLDARAQLPAARARLNAALDAQAEAEAKAQQAKDALKQAESDLEAAQEELAAIEEQLADTRSEVGDFARRAYQMGPYADLEMLLNASDPKDFTDRLAAIRSVSQSSNQKIGQLSTSRADQAYLELRSDALRDLAESKKAEADNQLERAKAAAQEAKVAKQLVDLLVEQRDAAMNIARAQQSKVKDQYAQLQAEQARIAAAAQRAAELAAQLGKGAGFGLGQGSGQYLWPISGGAIAQLTGPRIHPVYGYRSCHTGVDISGGYGTPILAVADGYVASVTSGGPYGLHTIVAHGGSVSSFYAHQSVAAVQPGQQVRRGQVIGYVGATGWVTGPHLHFEIHVDGVPYDPLGWYGGQKVPVIC